MVSINQAKVIKSLVASTGLLLSTLCHSDELFQFYSRLESITVSPSDARFVIDFIEISEPCPGMGNLVYAPLRDDNAEKFQVQKLIDAYNKGTEAHVKVSATEAGCILISVE